ncbi:DUF5986 family protein [Enterococcus sp. AZ192]|uniref:DUF5986 family protein n=1 Tax=unclassified Enterococcus TaxID=2608891 RepID=UPI003D294D0C
MNFSEQELEFLVKGFTQNNKDELDNNAIENSFVTRNGESAYSWNYTFGEISNAALKHGLRYIIVERTKIWQFVAVISKDGSELVLFFREKNLNKILSEFQDKPFHYLNCLLVINKHLDGQEINHQMSMFDIDETIDETRLFESKKMLQEDFEKIKTVYVCSKEEIYGNVVSVSLNLLNSIGELVEKTDLTDYGTFDYVTTAGINEDNKPSSTIPQLKQGIIDDHKKDIATDKDKDDIAENDESD